MYRLDVQNRKHISPHLARLSSLQSQPLYKAHVKCPQPLCIALTSTHAFEMRIQGKLATSRHDARLANEWRIAARPPSISRAVKLDSSQAAVWFWFSGRRFKSKQIMMLLAERLTVIHAVAADGVSSAATPCSSQQSRAVAITASGSNVKLSRDTGHRPNAPMLLLGAASSIAKCWSVRASASLQVHDCITHHRLQDYESQQRALTRQGKPDC